MTVHNWFDANRKRLILVSVMFFAGACASVLMYWITAQGTGTTPDSINYIEVTRNLLRGNGFVAFDRAMTHYPPGYSFLLSGISLFTHGDIFLAARLTATFLFSVNLVLLSGAAYICTKRSVTAVVCAIFIFLSSTPNISIHASTLSEALFITLSLTGFIFVSYHMVRPNVCLLVIASLMMGFAAATRYIGIVLFPTVILAIFLLSNRSFKYKMRDILVFSFIACAPLLSWLIHNIRIAESATDRTFAFHPFGLNQAMNFIAYMYHFVLPITFISNFVMIMHVGIATTLLILSCVILLKKMYIKQNAMSINIILPTILIIYFLLYVIFLIISISFIDANTPTDYRILLPVYLPLTVVCLSVFKTLADVLKLRLLWTGYVLFILCSVIINATYTIPTVIDFHSNGSGFTARYWKESKTLAALSEIPAVTKIYSNAPDVIQFLKQRQTDPIPSKGTTGTLEENKNYQNQLHQMISDCQEGRALIVYFNALAWRSYLPSRQEIEAMGNIPVVVEFDDGVIYGVPLSKSTTD